MALPRRQFCPTWSPRIADAHKKNLKKKSFWITLLVLSPFIHHAAFFLYVIPKNIAFFLPEEKNKCHCISKLKFYAELFLWYTFFLHMYATRSSRLCAHSPIVQVFHRLQIRVGVEKFDDVRDRDVESIDHVRLLGFYQCDRLQRFGSHVSEFLIADRRLQFGQCIVIFCVWHRAVVAVE